LAWNLGLLVQLLRGFGIEIKFSKAMLHHCLLSRIENFKSTLALAFTVPNMLEVSMIASKEDIPSSLRRQIF
jgi:hypothetical protein